MMRRRRRRRSKMDPDTLRTKILQHTAKHEETKAGRYLEDTALAAAIGELLADIQKQIGILKESGLLDVVEVFGPSYQVCLTPKGELALEAPPPTTPTTPIGF
jgi:hypothetical protein